MNRILLLIFCCLSCIYGQAQESGARTVVLQLTRQSTSGAVALTIKPHKKIRLRTIYGDDFTFHDYSFLGDSAIVSGKDTIALQDVKVFKGNVKGNQLRKAGGVALATAGGYLTTTGAIYTMLSALTGVNPLLALLTIPALGVTIAGSELAGARRFDTSEKWQISVINQPE
ncbi:hypothetical protein ACSX1A_08635 [Pontibacter sp. MBLB2868]|uniref:hypothetical protein n=1 Tax=Pontibacter sp. MBLB2868 TaxID=3451555 RepID=UPI003F7537AC